MHETGPDAVATVRAFVERINAHDVDGLVALMDDEHTMVDAWGQEFRKDVLHDAWRKFFEAFPDYEVEARHVLAQGPAIGIFGRARGTSASEAAPPAERNWSLPAAWLAIVRNSRVLRWEIMCDASKISRSMGVSP